MKQLQLFLINLNLKTFTEQNAKDYCLLNNINQEDLIELDLSDNQLTDISGIKIFKNLKYLWLSNNKIKNITVLKDLKKLESLNIENNQITDISILKYLNIKKLFISNLELESDQIQYIKSLKNFKTLFGYKGFKDMSVLNELNKSIQIQMI